MKTYGVYVNPYPSAWFNPSRLKTEARLVNRAFWVKGKDMDDALDYFISECKEPLRSYLKKNRDNPKVILIEEKEIDG